MEFLHYDVELNAGDIVEISLDRRANVVLLDQLNFLRYRQREHFTYHGGHASRTPFHIAAPQAGSWHVVVDLGSYARHVNAVVKIMHRGE